MRSWTPRRPSAKLRSRIFSGAPTIEVPSVAFGEPWRWLAPVMGLFLFVAIVSGPRNGQIDYLTAIGTNDLLAPLRNDRGYAYVMTSFHSKQNTLEDSLEWTSRQRFISSTASLPLLNTNSLKQ